MFAAFWGNSRPPLAIGAPTCIFYAIAGLEDLTVSDEAG